MASAGGIEQIGSRGGAAIRAADILAGPIENRPLREHKGAPLHRPAYPRCVVGYPFSAKSDGGTGGNSLTNLLPKTGIAHPQTQKHLPQRTTNSTHLLVGRFTSTV